MWESPSDWTDKFFKQELEAHVPKVQYLSFPIMSPAMRVVNLMACLFSHNRKFSNARKCPGKSTSPPPKRWCQLSPILLTACSRSLLIPIPPTSHLITSRCPPHAATSAGRVQAAAEGLLPGPVPRGGPSPPQSRTPTTTGTQALARPPARPPAHPRRRTVTAAGPVRGAGLAGGSGSSSSGS